MKRGLVFAMTLLAGCATLTPVTRVPPVRDSAGVAPSPATEWTPPANAIPPRPATADITPAPAGTLSLPQVIDLALSNNPATRTAWLEARAAEAALGSARSAYLPEVDLNATLSRSRGTGSAQTVFGPSLTLNYLLFDFGGREAEVAQARQALIAADYLHNQAIQDTILFAEESYYGVLGSRALLAGQDATIKERQAEVDAAEARHRAGVATIADVLQAKTALSQAQLTRETFEGSLRAFEGNLATAMGLPANTPVEIGELPAEVPAAAIGQQVDELIARAASARPDLAASRADAERARARVQQVRAQGLPSVSLNSSVGHTITGGGSTPYSISVGMRWPIFTGFRNQFDVREAQAQAQRAAEQARGVEQRVGLQVWTSYFGVQTAAARLATARDLLASATQSADVAASRYRAGVGSILDVLTAQAALENARAQEVQSRTDWFLSMAQLAHDTGTLGK
jgi:TolC family type I secretion outer membrane protein